jgi:type I restriction enzyme R subunit
LTENLTIEPDDFDALPVFNRVGGWGRADKVFAGQLSQLISRFNEAVAL